MHRFTVALVAFSALYVASARAAELNFTAALDGASAPTITGSTATGAANISVDTEAQTVSVHLRVNGISQDNLWDHVIHSGMGPVHLHLYGANGDISLLIPFPYGASYAATAGGFTLDVEDYSYAEGARVLRSEMGFDEFVRTLGSDFVYVNIHTDAYQDGEISGRLRPRA